MSTLQLSADDDAFRKAVRRIVDDEVGPRAATVDEEEVFPKEGVRLLSDLGLSGLAIATEYGGLGASRLKTCLAIEEIARGCGSTALAMMANVHSSGVIQSAGSDQQCQTWLPDVASGRHLAGVAITEPDAGTDIGSMRTAAKKEGDGFRLNGAKTYITGGGVAAFYVVFARFGAGEGKNALSAFVVSADSAGLTVSAPLKKLGLRGSITSELYLDDVMVDQDSLIGMPGQGYQLAVESLDGARLSTAAQALGLARGSFGIVKRFVEERHQFGRPIVGFQAVQLRLADMYVAIQAATSVLHAAATTYDLKPPAAERALAASVAKIHCTDAAVEVCNKAVEMMGGLGFMREAGVERYLRDVKGTQIYDGTNDINRLNVVRQLLAQGR